MNIKSVWVIALSLIAPALPAQEKFNLEFNYRQGGIYRYRTTDTFSSQQEVNGQDLKITGGNNSLIRMEVVSVAPDSSITFITAYEEMKTKIKSTMMDTVMDQKGLIGKREKVTLSRLGKEISKEELDSIDISGSNISISIGSSHPVNFFYLPGHPVSAGEKWMAEIHDSVAIGDGYRTQTGSIEYTLSNVREQKNGHNCLKIDFSSKSEQAGKMKQMGMDVFLEGTADTSGIIWFDAETGILVLKESDTIQDMTFAIAGPMTMSIPMTQTIKSSYLLVEK